MKVIVEPHNPAWLLEFAKTQAQLQEILKGIPITAIEHVGSTSIPNLPAKPVLDIDIIISPDALPATRSALVAAGYLDLGELGIPGRYVFRQPGYGVDEWADGLRGKNGEFRRNTYVCLEGSANLRNHLDLKRVLLQDEELRREYGDVKLAIANEEVKDADEYCKRKNEVMIKILEKAGWRDEELEEVRKANA